MIFWNEYNSPHIIEDEPFKQADKYNVEMDNISLEKPIKEWFCYAIICSRRYNLSIVHESCLVYYTTLYMTDEGISTGTEEKYFMKKLDNVIMDIYLSVPLAINEVERKKCFFRALLDFFRNGLIKQYERHLFQHNIRVNDDIKEWFDSMGKVKETIISLMDGKIRRPHLNANIRGNNNIVFLLTYSEELKWKKLSQFGDPDRLRELIY